LGSAQPWRPFLASRVGAGNRAHRLSAGDCQDVGLFPGATLPLHWDLTKGDGNVLRLSASALLSTWLFLFGLALPAQAADPPAGEAAATSLPEPTDPDVRARERDALITFYEALGGPDWIQRDFWGSDRPVGEWHGVETDSEGRVVRLTIYDNNLVGELSPAICELERLHTLHLSFNKISGHLPEALGACRALKNLWIKGNKLTGQIPNAVAQLPELEYLDVHANNLSGPLPTTWNTPKLKIFRGEDNEITGALPEQLFLQPSLEQVFLHNNRLSGPLPGTLSGAANLHSLLLADNMLSGSIPNDIGKLGKLTDLRLNKNQLSGSIPDSLTEAASLQVLRLDDNQLTGPVPEGLADRLTVFDVSGNPGLEASP